jgi:hypothetical protein
LLEPLRFQHLDRFHWMVIGGASKSSKTPQWAPPFVWIVDVVKQAREAGLRVYFKDNLFSRNARILELLFDYMLPIFKTATGIDVHVVAVGTGQALAIGERGDADALLVHDRPGEDKFVAEGYGIDRRDVMYNDFVIVGPNTDPAHIRGLKDARKALTQIADAKAPFASRGDDSGTNRMELRLWKSAGIQPDAHSDWYRDLGQGIGPGGKPSRVLASTINAPRPRKRYTASAVPSGPPITRAHRLAVRLTSSDRMTISRRSASLPAISASAVPIAVEKSFD